MDSNDTNRPAGGPVDILIEKWIYGGMGLGRIEGRVVLAPFVLPGETARVRVTAARRDLWLAGLVSITRAAPERIEAPCPYFGRCGGCHYQHAPYDFQLAQKRSILEESLRRIGKIGAPDGISVISGPAWEYRNRVQLHIDRARIGFREPASHRLCAIGSCPLCPPRINGAIRSLAAMTRHPRFPRFLRSLELFDTGSEMQIHAVESGRGLAPWFYEWCGESIAGATRAAVVCEAAGRSFRVSPRSFFQVNRFLTGRLVETAIAGAEGETALDLYAGVGLFSLPLAERFRKVVAVESGSSAVADLDCNASAAGAAVEIHRGSCESVLDTLDARPDFVLADPPRSGLNRFVVRHLLRMRPPRLAIVSCDPATLARDLAALAAGGFRLERLTLIDLFPQTAHLETVAHLRLA